jgi:hypothetical protein
VNAAPAGARRVTGWFASHWTALRVGLKPGEEAISREGRGVRRNGRFSLLRVAKGFQTVQCRGPGYFEERVRPVRALIFLGKIRLFFVRGAWQVGRTAQYWVPRGTELLDPADNSEIGYMSERAAAEDNGIGCIFWSEAVKEKATRQADLARPEPEKAYEFLMKANAILNTVVYGMFLGRADNNTVFPVDDIDPVIDPEGWAANGKTACLINRMTWHLEYLRDVFSADSENVKAWRRERLEAHDALVGVSARVGGDYERFKATPEYQRWDAIRDVGPLEYPARKERQ